MRRGFSRRAGGRARVPMCLAGHTKVASTDAASLSRSLGYGAPTRGGEPIPMIVCTPNHQIMILCVYYKTRLVVCDRNRACVGC